MSKAFFELLGICSKLNKKDSILIGCINVFWIVTVQIQTRHVRDHIGKENTTISLVDGKIIMFDHESVKTMEVIWSLSIYFSGVKSKKVVTQKYEDKGLNMHSPLEFFLNEFMMWFFS